ncbi:uncharacterized protein N7479_001768 [Penicillium vulpinum]|uniref:uncharacterized protein n=1 Tax=Penicillium vulpinum TaxID=29845 RepID=UPI0025471138|nr:uncharacterized protein N7479_001768 [Penicillium vulpinum]KAJ5971850.1 hypothetical protein N7479_001768 [Penicillium vulpinum]
MKFETAYANGETGESIAVKITRYGDGHTFQLQSMGACPPVEWLDTSSRDRPAGTAQVTLASQVSTLTVQVKETKRDKLSTSEK